MAFLDSVVEYKYCFTCGACRRATNFAHAVDCPFSDVKYEQADDVIAGIGDVKSDARGSGARFNSGKAPVELIPVWLIALHEGGRYQSTSVGLEAWRLLRALGDWQRGLHDTPYILAEFSDDWTTDCARVFDYGRKKYAEWNWAKGMPWSVPLACAVRHCLAILRGEENDPESSLPHRGHVACNVVMLAQYESSYPEGDDRPWRLLAPAAEKSA